MQPDHSTSSNPVTSVLPALDLTDRNIKLAKPGDVLKDVRVKGLHLRVFEESRSFYLYFRTKAGKQRRPKLGEYGSITLAQAREVAQEMMAEVAAGRDPSQARADARAEPTVSELWDEVWKRRLKDVKSKGDLKRQWEMYLMPAFGAKRLSEVTYSMVSDFMAEHSDIPYQANRCLTLLGGMFNFAMKPLHWVERNPCDAVTRYKEAKRRRYMTGEEAARIAEVLDRRAKSSPTMVAFMYLLILTGARKSEIRNAKWEWLDGNVLRLPDSKTGAKSVYLPPQAMEVIGRLERTSGTITGVRRPDDFWRSVRKEAGCEDLRLHDLRHSFASAALSAGLSLSQIGELLGHASTQTTKRYAHLVEEVATASAAATADVIMAGMRRPVTSMA